MEDKSLFHLGRYSLDWVKSFYSQARLWWGPDVQGQAVYQWRAAAVERLCGPGSKRILDLGAASGGTMAAMADLGHAVVGVEFSPIDAVYAREFFKTPRKGPVNYVEGDFYSVSLEGRFDVVCYWDGFGVGTDDDQRRLLRRTAQEWLAPGGVVLLDIFHPARFARHAGEAEILPPLPGVPDSVEMLHRTHFDPLHFRWIDEWIPTAAPENALAQTLRCYSIPDFQLLLEGTGLKLTYVEAGDEVIDFANDAILLSGCLMEAYSYLAVLKEA